MANKLNGKDLESVFGVFIERSGLNDFLAFPKRKSSQEHDWPELNGKEVDLANPTFEARQFTLKCVLTARGADEQQKNTNFWNLYNGLFTELSGQGSHSLQLASINKAYTVFYVDQQGVEKVTYEEDRMIVRFDLIFQETDPFANIQKVYLVDHNGTFLVA